MNDPNTSQSMNQEDQVFDLNTIPADEAARELGKDAADMHVDPLAPPEPTLEAPIRQWRVAKSLLRLRTQIDEAFPMRRKDSDGTIGDAAHASRNSDHNPWIVDNGIGVVSALDVTNDPAHSCDSGRIAEALRLSRDPRLKYIISNRKIANALPIGAAPAWAWRTYTGSNPHDHHCHISVRSEKTAYDDTRDWNFQAREEPEAVANAETALSLPLAAALDALPGNPDRPLFERLVDAQDEISALLSVHAAQFRAVRAEDVEEGARPTFEQLKPEYDSLWASCQIRPERSGTVAWYVGKLLRYKPRYEEVSTATRAPWWFVGIVHALEASFNFQAHLHNGDPLSARTVHAPANRPPRWNPPTDWLSSAVDAITSEGFAGQSDWSIARALYRFEGFNGYSYHGKNINSPYLWSFSNHYTKGKYVRDHVYDGSAVSNQCGAAVMLKAMQIAGDVAL